MRYNGKGRKMGERAGKKREREDGVKEEEGTKREIEEGVKEEEGKGREEKGKRG